MNAQKMIVFDFDGTIADSLEAALQIYNRLAPDYALARILVEDLPTLRQLNLREIVRKLGVKPRHIPILLNRARLMLRDQMGDLKACQGVLEELGHLRSQSVRFGILTSNSVENVEIFLRHHGVRHYFEFITSCSKLRGKAKFLQTIARTHSLGPGEMIYVGDEVRDVKAAKKAGVPMAGVTWGFNSREALEKLSPEWLLSDPIGLRDLAKEIWQSSRRAV